ELRDEIYSIVFYSTYISYGYVNRSSYAYNTNQVFVQSAAYSIAILRSCRRINLEIQNL
ncbi:hypothetical protein B0H63DRAFT_405522, partial [Podospora didyma]